MKKTKTRRADPVEQAMRRLEGVDRVALMARAAMDMPTGTPALDAAQDAAFAATERALAALERRHNGSPR